MDFLPTSAPVSVVCRAADLLPERVVYSQVVEESPPQDSLSIPPVAAAGRLSVGLAASGVHAASSFVIHTTLYAAAAISKHCRIFTRPTCRALRIPTTVLAHPENSSTSFRRCWLLLNAARRYWLRTNQRVQVPSSARALVGSIRPLSIATCGSIQRRSSATRNSPAIHLPMPIPHARRCRRAWR